MSLNYLEIEALLYMWKDSKNYINLQLMFNLYLNFFKHWLLYFKLQAVLIKRLVTDWYIYNI